MDICNIFYKMGFKSFDVPEKERERGELDVWTVLNLKRV